MQTLSNMVGFLFPEFELGWIVDEFRENLTSEFDFTNEARYKYLTEAACTILRVLAL